MTHKTKGRCKLLLKCPEGITELPADMVTRQEPQEPKPFPKLELPDLEPLRPTVPERKERQTKPKKGEGQTPTPARVEKPHVVHIPEVRTPRLELPHPELPTHVNAIEAGTIRRGARKGMGRANAVIAAADLTNTLLEHSDEIATVADALQVLYNEYGHLIDDYADAARDVAEQFIQDNWAAGVRGIVDIVNPAPVVTKLADTLLDKAGIDLPSVTKELDPFSPGEFTGGVDVTQDDHFVYIKPNTVVGADDPLVQWVQDAGNYVTEKGVELVNAAVDTGKDVWNTVKGWFT